MPQEESKEIELIVNKMSKLKIGESFTVKKDYKKVHKALRNIIFQSRTTARYSAISKMSFSMKLGNTFVVVIRMA